MAVTLEEITTAIRDRLGGNSGLNATVKFDFNGGGVVYIDGKAVPHAVSNEDREADCVIAISTENFEKMMKGELGSTMAFMTGKLKVKGNMGVAMKVAPILEG